MPFIELLIDQIVSETGILIGKFRDLLGDELNKQSNELIETVLKKVVIVADDKTF